VSPVFESGFSALTTAERLWHKYSHGHVAALNNPELSGIWEDFGALDSQARSFLRVYDNWMSQVMYLLDPDIPLPQVSIANCLVTYKLHPLTYMVNLRECTLRITTNGNILEVPEELQPYLVREHNWGQRV
jgi:hypothetical protein